ncbi:hypothetical protein O3M35_007061 [Rhynocoris fuscipes]|uniref:Reverse transcriptase domain-containing protein n=1 Tax=Rhynocoris fuscipes TaxID=488301 RepID=A0AAW1D8V2_9HEMI
MKIKEWTYKKDIKEIEEVIQKGCSLKKCLRAQSIGQKTIIAMKDDQGTIRREEKEILNVICTFYKNLYSMPINMEEEEIELPEMEEKPNPILKSEVECTLKKLKNGKTGGLDNIVNEQLKRATMKIKVGNMSRSIELNRGLRQGDVPSAKFFGCVLEEAFRKCEWESYGININGERLNKMKFADDVVLIGKSMSEIECMLNELTEEAKKLGLNINPGKTKLLKINNYESIKIKVKNEEIEEVEEFVYLGQLVAKEDPMGREIKRRIRLSWAAYNRHRKLFRSGVKMETKAKLWNSVVKPVLIYGSETWCLTNQSIDKLRKTVRRMERSMLKVGRRERKTNRWVRQQTGLEDVAKVIMEKKWRWAGHIVRSEDNRWAKKIIEWYPRDMSRRRGRPKLSWDMEMRRCCGGSTWQRVAHDRMEWSRMGEVYRAAWLPPE